jgi:hypothetical protein
LFKTSAELFLENLALGHQLGVLRRSAPKQLRLTPADRIFWVWLRRVWGDCKSVLMIVKPETVIAWHPKGFQVRKFDPRASGFEFFFKSRGASI